MDDKDKNKDYILDNDEECLRLERQAKLYGFEDDLKHLSFVYHGPRFRRRMRILVP